MRQYPDACNILLVLKIQGIDARSWQWSSTLETSKGPVKKELTRTTHVEEPFESANDSLGGKPKGLTRDSAAPTYCF